MNTKDHSALIAAVEDEYRRAFPASRAAHQRAKRCLVDGGSHTLRLHDPFPQYITSAKGAWVRNLDGNELLDFWQGHFANILGHNPELVTGAMSSAYLRGWGLQTGHLEELQAEVAEILVTQTGMESLRFTTSGSLATMYAIMLARAFTGRHIVAKVGGGWHGAQPWGLKGVGYGDLGYEGLESLGLPHAIDEETLMTRFNDGDDLESVFRMHGDSIACLIIEPWVGGGGFIAGEPAYLQAARELTCRYGALLVFDEVITGFRFRAGDVGSMYGIRPDLAVFGKIIGGGMPVAAVGGRRDIMTLCGHEGGRKVRFDGGTFAAHPAALLASKAILEHLVANEEAIYPSLAAMGERVRRRIEAAFAREGVHVRCTGYGNESVPGSSLAMIHFPLKAGADLVRPEDVWDPRACDVPLRERFLKLALLLEGVNVTHGLGTLSTEHGEREFNHLIQGCSHVAERMRDFRRGR